MYAHDYLHMYIPYMPVLDVCCSFFYMYVLMYKYMHIYGCVFFWNYFRV